MIKRTFRLLSDEKLKKRREKQEEDLKELLNEEYESYKKYINFYELPEIQKINILSLKGCDASVLPNLSRVEIRINDKFLGDKFPEYLKVILFHEFTHIWDAATNYGNICESNLTEYHAVQVAFAKNIGQRNISEWEKFSEKQYVWNYDKRVTVAQYVKDIFENYSYKMEYNYYNETEERTHQFMYDLCQWIGYSVIFEKYCLEWEGKRKHTVFIPEEIAEEIEQFYIGLRDNHEIKQIVLNYTKIQAKFKALHQMQVWGEENYFLSEANKEVRITDSFMNRCMAIEDIYADMKRKHTDKYIFSRPYLNKSFALQYFRKMYYEMLEIKDTHSLFKKYMEHYILDCPDEIKKLNNALIEIKSIFETTRYFEVVIKKIKSLDSVEILMDDNGKEYYCIERMEQFIEEMKFAPAFLSALLMGIADAGYSLQFSKKVMTIRQG